MQGNRTTINETIHYTSITESERIDNVESCGGQCDQREYKTLKNMAMYRHKREINILDDLIKVHDLLDRDNFSSFNQF